MATRPLICLTHTLAQVKHPEWLLPCRHATLPVHEEDAACSLTSIVQGLVGLQIWNSRRAIDDDIGSDKRCLAPGEDHRPMSGVLKLQTLYQRRKGRDLFDLWLCLEQRLIDPSVLLIAFSNTWLERVTH